MKRPKKLYFLEYEHNGQVWVKHFKSAAARSRTVRTHPHLKVLRMWTETREERENSWPDDAAGHRAAALKRARGRGKVSRREYFRGLPVVGVTPGDSNAGPNQRIRRVPLADLKPTQRLKETLAKAKGRDVERYRALLREGKQPPPLTGSFDARTGKVHLSEGHRRLESLKAEGKTYANVIIGGLGEPAPEPVYTGGQFDAAKTFALDSKMPARKNSLCVVNPSRPGGLRPVELISDRAKRYRAQGKVEGPRQCAICGAKRSAGGRALDVMHLDGDESNGESKNLAYGCRSCNATLGAAFKALGSKNRTVQYNPEGRKPPTFDQWKWAVVHHLRGEHDEGGAIIHATPRRLRIEYNREIYETRRRRGDFEVPF